MRSGTEKITSGELQTTVTWATVSKRTCISSIWRINTRNFAFLPCQISELWHHYQLHEFKTPSHTKNMCFALNRALDSPATVSVMHITIPRNPYHYKLVAVKLPGSIVAMATLSNVDFLIVVLFCMYFFATRAHARTQYRSHMQKKKKKKNE